LKSDIWWQQF